MYLVRSGDDSLLLEAGATIHDIFSLGEQLSGISHCFVSHKHKDHSQYVKSFIAAGIDVYGPEDVPLASNLAPFETIEAGPFTVTPFPGHHDVPVFGYVIEAEGRKLLFITDSCYTEYQFTGVSDMVIECNYTPTVLGNNVESGKLNPAQAKRIIESHHGLENCIRLIEDCGDTVESILLCHLSDLNSDEKEILKEVVKVAPPGCSIEIAAKVSGRL